MRPLERLRRRPYAAFFGALVAVALGYTLWRALELRIDYCDSFMYRQSAMRLWGYPVEYFDLRPPLLAILLAPVIELGRALGGSPETMFGATALEAAILSGLSVVAVLLALKRPLGWSVGLFGALLFVGNRLFVRYGAHVMTDVITAGTIAAALWSYHVGRDRRHLAWFVLTGLFLGLTALLRYNVMTIFAGLFVGEALVAARRWRVHDRAFVGLMLASVVALVLFVLVHRVVFERVYGDPDLERLVRIFEELRTGSAANRGDEAPLDYLWMGVRAFGELPLVLAAVGLLLALVTPKDEDGAFLGVLLAVGGGLFITPHTEARYALPIFPCVVYFAARAAGHVAAQVEPVLEGRPRLRPVAALVVVAITGVCVRPGLAQAELDRDPIFRTPAFQDVARYVAASNGGRAWWNGITTTLCPAEPALFPEDDFWNVFHSCVEGLTFYTGSPPLVARERGPALQATLARRAEDGDAVVRLSDPTWLDTRALVKTRAAMRYDVWRVARTELALRDGRYEHAGGRRGISVTVPAGDDRAGPWTVRSQRARGPFVVYAWGSAAMLPSRLGTVELAPGRDVSFAGHAPGPLPDRLVLLGAADARTFLAR